MLSKKTLVRRARHLRKNMTSAERILWSRLRRRQLGVKFRRQHVLPPYIVDFYCHDEKLVVEVDGDRHSNESVSVADNERDEFLQEEHGIVEVLRFSNEDVIGDVDGVVEAIREVVEED